MFWIAFQLGSLIGFIFIGIVSFKLTTDEMNAQAGKFLANSTVWDRQILTNGIVFSEFSTNITIPFSSACYPRFIILLSSCMYCVLVVCRSISRGHSRRSKLSLPCHPLGFRLSPRFGVTDLYFLVGSKVYQLVQLQPKSRGTMRALHA
jgi:hypothetical protein